MIIEKVNWFQLESGEGGVNKWSCRYRCGLNTSEVFDFYIKECKVSPDKYEIRCYGTITSRLTLSKNEVTSQLVRIFPGQIHVSSSPNSCFTLQTNDLLELYEWVETMKEAIEHLYDAHGWRKESKKEAI